MTSIRFEKYLAERKLPHLRIEMWGTQVCDLRNLAAAQAASKANHCMSRTKLLGGCRRQLARSVP